jgi:hypothetical protein
MSVSTLQFWALVADAIAAAVLVLIGGIVWGRRREEKAAATTAGHSAPPFNFKRPVVGALGVVAVFVAGCITGTIWAWSEMANQPSPIPSPGPSSEPTDKQQEKPRPTTLTIDDPGSSVDRCVVIKGTVSRVPKGYSVVVGERVWGEDTNFYEVATMTGNRFSAEIEVGDEERENEYELTALLIKTTERDLLVDVSRNASAGNDEMTWFGTSKDPLTKVADDSVKVSRNNDKPCN